MKVLLRANWSLLKDDTRYIGLSFRAVKRVVYILLLIFICIPSCQKEPSLVYSGPPTLEFGENGSYTLISFTASHHWRIQCSEPWVSFSKTSGSGSERSISVIVYCEHNTTYENRECTFAISINGIKQIVSVTQADNNGLLAVDIGLPVLWASCNLGASKPWEYGNYYAWGEIEPKSLYTWETYKWNKKYKDLTKYNFDEYLGVVDNKMELDSQDDVANVLLGEKWRIPTRKDFETLIATKDNSKYKWELKSIHGQRGWEIRYLRNGNSIFFPLPGEKVDISVLLPEKWGKYWSSSLGEYTSTHASHLNLEIDREPGIVGYDRSRGYPVRAVRY